MSLLSHKARKDTKPEDIAQDWNANLPQLILQSGEENQGIVKLISQRNRSNIYNNSDYRKFAIQV